MFCTRTKTIVLFLLASKSITATPLTVRDDTPCTCLPTAYGIMCGSRSATSTIPVIGRGFLGPPELVNVCDPDEPVSETCKDLPLGFCDRTSTNYNEELCDLCDPDKGTDPCGKKEPSLTGTCDPTTMYSCLNGNSKEAYTATIVANCLTSGTVCMLGIAALNHKLGTGLDDVFTDFCGSPSVEEVA